jgi:hypothetical protein
LGADCERKALRNRAYRAIVFPPFAVRKIAYSSTLYRRLREIWIERLKFRGAFKQQIAPIGKTTQFSRPQLNNPGT